MVLNMELVKKGDVELCAGILLKDVLFVPTFYFNLISVYKICINMAVTITFSQHFCFLQDCLKKIFFQLGDNNQGLYYTVVQKTFSSPKSRVCQPHTSLVSSKTMFEHAKLWHFRLGHTPFSKLKALFPDIDTKGIKDSLICTICPASRQTRLPFHDSYIKTSLIFNPLHIDIWGPYPHKTHNGCDFFLTIVDGFFILITWLYLLKNKSDCVDMITHLFAFIKNRLMRVLKAFELTMLKVM